MRIATLISVLLIPIILNSQTTEVDYIKTVTDTVWRTSTERDIITDIYLEPKKFHNDNNTLIKILDASGTLESGEKILADGFYSSARYETRSNINAHLNLSYVFAKTPQKILKVKGKLRVFTPTVEKNSIINIDSIIKKGNSVIVDNSDFKIVFFDLTDLTEIEKRYLDYDKNFIVKNKLDKNKFQTAIKKCVKNYPFPVPNLTARWCFYVEKKKDFDVDISVQNQQTELCYQGSIGRCGDSGSRIIVFSFFKNAPQENWGIKVVCENDNSIKDYDFEKELR